jgi:hypothetical protein
MSARPSLDRDSFQTFLANAYAVQTSGLDTRSLSALIEMQRFIRGDEFDLDRAMLMMAEHALKVCNASGVAIALLEGKGLVYRAVSGSAVNDAGRQVPAVLSVASGSDVRREILRVENAQIDSRVEAEVCRQFGANSILMLPIYKKYVLFGVLQVQFDEAHSFLEGEIRAYRLMLGVLEEGIVRHLPSQQRSAASITAKETAHGSGPSRELQATNTARPLIVVADVVEQKMWPRDDSSKQTKKLDHRMAILSTLRKVNPAIWNELDRLLANAHFWQVASAVAVSVSVMLAIATWSYRNHAAPTTNDPALSADRDNGQQLPAKVLLAGMKEEQPGNGAKQTTAKISAFRRVRIGLNEVDYLAEDVTIRTFTAKAMSRRVRDFEKELRIGDDVTVRYFAPSAVPVSSGQRPQ